MTRLGQWRLRRMGLVFEPRLSNTFGRKRLRRTKFYPELLEGRELLVADLIAHWLAEDLVAKASDGQTLTAWADRVGQIEATTAGTPIFRTAVLGGRSAIETDASNATDGFMVRGTESPMPGLTDFTLLVTFSTSDVTLVGQEGAWYQNTALVDGNSSGFAADWGLTLNSQGKLAAGLGRGLAQPVTTLYSAVSGLNDGKLHSVLVTRAGTQLSLYVDDQAVVSRDDAPAAPLASTNLGIGQLSSLANATNQFRGLLAEVRVYQGGMTDTEAHATLQEVTKYYNNQPPVANEDAYAIPEDARLTVAASEGVLANDTDSDQDPLTAVLVGSPLHGQLTLNADGSFAYEPEPNYFGADSFSYYARESLNSELTTVHLSVTPVNDLPRAAPDRYTALTNSPIHVALGQGVLSNDRDIDGPVFFAELVSTVAHGTLTLEPSGAFLYVPATDFAGEDQFVYRAKDSLASTEDMTVHIQVTSSPARINELMAVNLTTLGTHVRANTLAKFSSGPREYFDWIELTNPSAQPLNIGGLYLTNASDDPYRWQIPAGTVIAPQSQWLVYASGLDLRDTQLDETGHYHTNFKLSAQGDYLALTAPGEVILDALTPRYPQQRSDISYGLDALGILRYLKAATPAATNSEGYPGVVAATQFSVDRGFYQTPQVVAISTNTVGATIYYTTDGSEPSPTNPGAVSYAGPLTVHTTSTLRAVAYLDGMLPSNINTQTYLFLSDVIQQGNMPVGYPTEWKNLAGTGVLPADYEMDPEITQKPAYNDIMDDALLAIPTISIVTDIGSLFDRATGIYQNPVREGEVWERPASVEYILPDGTVGFQINAGLRIQGGASREPEKSPKHSFRLLFKDQYGASKLEYPLFGNGAVDQFDTFTLRAGFNQSFIHHNNFLGDNRGRGQYVRDQWAKDTQLAMGGAAAHNLYAHLYINGIYWGLYNPTERPDAAFGAAYLGGEKAEYDVLNSGEVIDGNSMAWNELLRRSRADLTDATNYAAVEQLLDIDAFIDYMVLNHYGGNQDWDSHNWYVMRRRVDEGKFTFQVWDSEFIFINVNDNRIRVRDAAPGQMFDRLSKNSEFKIKLADAIQRLMFHDGVLTPDAVRDRWNARSSQVEVAIVAETARWGDYRRDVHRSGGPYELIERDVQWVKERDRLLNDYFPQRTGIVVEQYRKIRLFPSIDAPTFSNREMFLAPGSALELSAVDGTTIYFTMDGTDPRLPGGEINPAAFVYTGPIVLTADARIATRAFTADREWSALDSFAFLVSSVPASDDSLRISEVHYNPAAPTEAEIGAGFRDNDQFEFVELVNISAQRIDLSAVRFEQQTHGDTTVGIGFDFALSAISQLDPGQRLVVVEDLAAFAARYGAAIPVAGQWMGGLSNSSELITLTTNGETIHQFAYEDTWYTETDGAGYSLENRNPAAADLDVWGTSTGWKVSTAIGGSPGSDVGRVPGDANGDGIFNSSDLVLVFQFGEYEDAVVGNSTFAEGDWNGDGDFTTADLVYAFQNATFIAAARLASDQRISDRDPTAEQLNQEAIDAAFAADEWQRPLQVLFAA